MRFYYLLYREAVLDKPRRMGILNSDETRFSLRMGLIARRKSDQNKSGIDPWTAVHLSNGLAMGLMNVPLRWALPAAIAYELVEQCFERHEFGKRFFKVSGPEVLTNAVIDVAVFAAGHWLGRTWNES